MGQAQFKARFTMSNGRLAIIAIIFVMATVVFAPLAFFAGIAHGRAMATTPPVAPPQNADMAHNAPRALPKYARATICGAAVWKDPSNPASEVFCHPFFTAGQNQDKTLAKKTAIPGSPHKRPLQDKFVTAISADTPAQTPGMPLSSALPVDGAAAGPQGNFPFGAGFSGFPGALGPGFSPLAPEKEGDTPPKTGAPPGAPAIPPTAEAPPVDAPPPPVIVTPLPAALLLMGPGFGAILLAARRKKPENT